MFRLTATFGVAALLASVRAQSPIYGQCGGIGWTGATTCVSGSSCNELNAYYSQCLPGTASTSTTVSTTTTATSTSSTSTSTSTVPYFGGVNTAGYDFGMGTDGSVTSPFVAPPTSQYSHFAAEGVNIFRIPFAWQSMTPTLGGAISQSFLSEYQATVQTALNSGPNVYVIIDVHNYARWNGDIIGQGGPTNDQFASFWGLVAAAFADQPRIIFGIMNEPHDLTVSTWATSVQAAVNAIRQAGATSQYLLMPGSSYSSAQTLPTEAGPYLLEVTDPIGGTEKLLFDVHKYLDSDNSGTHPDCVTNNTQVLETLVQWLQQNGNRQALLSETGGGNTASCVEDLGQELAYIQQNSASIVGFSIWAAGAFATNYTLSVVPFSNGTDQILWTEAVQPYLP